MKTILIVLLLFTIGFLLWYFYEDEIKLFLGLASVSDLSLNTTTKPISDFGTLQHVGR